MLSDKELDQAASELAQFSTRHDEYHRSNTNILHKHAALIQESKEVRIELEEARDSRERYKQMAKGGERNLFVLVLVDGDGYVFDDDLLESKAQGGSRAAQLLNDTVQSSLGNRPGLESCNIMVRIYANLAGLSKAVSRAGHAGPEKRSLAPFVANFNRSNGLFDFVDAGELKENADFKIRAVFRQFVENTQCRHIYFAACHDVGYISELASYTHQRDRITLIRNYAFHKEFTRLGLRIEEFPGIFRATALPSISYGFADMPPLSSKFVELPISTATRHASTHSIAAETVCTFHQKGICKYGKACKLAHIEISTNGSTKPNVFMGDWRSSAEGASFQMRHLAESDKDFTKGRSKLAAIKPDFSMLPRESDIPLNMIPVNARQERLDSKQPYILAQDRAQYRARIAKQKLCNNHHLVGLCPSGSSCRYDHSAISEGVRNCLQEVARHNPCPRRQQCRSLDCFHGHICQRQDCQKRGGSTYCKLPFPMHNVDLSVTDYVRGTNAIMEENGDVTSSSVKDSPPCCLEEEETDQSRLQEYAQLDEGETDDSLY